MDYRYIARIKIEATTPLFVGSGSASLITDSLVLKDHNGLPMIPGTSLAGVLRHSLEDFSSDKKTWNNVFGFQGKENEGLGSRLIVSSANMVVDDDKVAEGFGSAIRPEIIQKFNKLPTRQHVRITEKGVAADKGLFDNEVVYAGAQFIFEIELKGTQSDKESWGQIINEIKSPAFRIGQGTRNGYGTLKVIGIYEDCFNLNDKNKFEEYLDFDPSLNSIEIKSLEDQENNNTADYILELTPDDFFIFSEGFGDAEVDNKPVTEEVMVYQNNKTDFVERTLIPASSIKGALAHRVAFYINKKKRFFVDQINSNLADYLNENNAAVAKLFGKKGDTDPNTKENTGQRGILLMDDLYYDDIDNSKIFNHVAIDRFTGGGIDGALFSEKVSYKKDKKMVLKINLSELVEDTDIVWALEEALKDVCRGLLPLGGMTTKGFGMFTGKLLKQGTEIYNYKSTKVET